MEEGEIMNELEEKKQTMFKVTLNVFKKYDDTTETDRAMKYWCEYKGLIKAIAIMGWEADFIAYCIDENWDVMLP